MTPSIPFATPDHWSNLLWALSAPDIAPEFPLPWLPPQRRERLHQFFSAPDICSRLRPELELELQNLKSRRLGIYFEQLWAFAFSHHPDYTLLARNLPIRRGEKTLGELDFVVRHLPDDTVEHWEVAVKFYLQVADYWVGPGLRDRLDIKLAHMQDHQLPMIQQPESRSQLHRAGLIPERQWAVMPGRLFASLDETNPSPRYWWTTARSFQRQFADRQWQWLQLPKQTWLAPCSGTNPLAPQPEEHLTQATAYYPRCVAGLQGATEVSRGFMVPIDWLAQARQHILLG
ncbi:DUF1853 family protein [Microbulbifer pacificus]|uniref:DUF1853 family protein n=1 Tax=Microbulbifer pacificus TaxID=407164 RepID=A0AAU0MVH1_9GAMM|nr:DUF1853 family protein [Microbulbifer pacificus]WOX04609.1 DUF1853 family protein [Microbulbifer pacificus]